jgi:hypothetical protein
MRALEDALSPRSIKGSSRGGSGAGTANGRGVRKGPDPHGGAARSFASSRARRWRARPWCRDAPLGWRPRGIRERGPGTSS